MKKILLLLAFFVLSHTISAQITPLDVWQWKGNVISNSTSVLGTKSNQPFSIITNSVNRLGFNTNGTIRTYSTVSTSTVPGTWWFNGTSTTFTNPIIATNGTFNNTQTNGTASVTGAATINNLVIPSQSLATGISVTADQTGNVFPMVIDGGAASNADIYFQGTNNSRLVLKNSTTAARWFIGNSTSAGTAGLDAMFIGSGNNPDAGFFSIGTDGYCRALNRVKIGALTAPGATRLDLAAGTAAVSQILFTTQTTLTLTALGHLWYTTSNLNFNGGFLSRNSFTAGIGYGAGTGSTVTQATNRTTGVTINAISGAITLVSAAGSAVYQTFVVTNSAVVATDIPVIVQKSGTDLNNIIVTAVGAGSFNVSFATTGGVTTEQPVFSFVIIKGSSN